MLQQKHFNYISYIFKLQNTLKTLFSKILKIHNFSLKKRFYLNHSFSNSTEILKDSVYIWQVYVKELIWYTISKSQNSFEAKFSNINLFFVARKLYFNSKKINLKFQQFSKFIIFHSQIIYLQKKYSDITHFFT